MSGLHDAWKSLKKPGFVRGNAIKTRDRIRERLLAETGRLSSQAPFTIALLYPSPYGAAMSSLGYQRIDS